VNCVPGTSDECPSLPLRQPRAASTHFAFGPFTLSTEGVSVEGRRVELTPMCLAVLRGLVRRAPYTFTHAEIAASCWPGRKASRASIARAIYGLRCALEAEYPDARGWLEPVYSRGYRLVAVAVKRVAPPPAEEQGPGPRANADAACERADLLAALHPDRLEEAASLYEHARRLDPSNRDALRGHVECIVWRAIGSRTPHLPDAVALRGVLAAVRALPPDAVLNASAALATVALGRRPACARAIALHALRLDARDPRVSWHAGLVALATGASIHGLDLLASAAYGASAHERIRRHWLRAPSALLAGLCGVPLLRAIDGVDAVAPACSRARRAAPAPREHAAREHGGSHFFIGPSCVVRARAGRQRPCGAHHPHAEGAPPVGAHVRDRADGLWWQGSPVAQYQVVGARDQTEFDAGPYHSSASVSLLALLTFGCRESVGSLAALHRPGAQPPCKATHANARRRAMTGFAVGSVSLRPIIR
jgi:DNA-binding winged helix-turn-helix (wHTH) protein